VSTIDDRTDEAFSRLEKELTDWAADGVDLLHDAIEASMRAPKTGRKYGSHQASAPGESPAIRTGKYLISISRDKQFLQATIGTASKIGLYLEKGTKKMAPRPHFESALRANKDILDARLQAAVLRAQL
jgi:hypothetical protein